MTMQPGTRPSTGQWTVRFDRGRHWRAKIGFVILANAQTVEDDLHRMAPSGVGIHVTRLRMPIEVTVDNLASMTDAIADAAAVLMPDAGLDVLCFSCTSGSVVIGEDRVMDELRRVAPGVKVTTLVTGVIAALRAVAARRVVIATPYIDEVNAREADYFSRCGFDILDIQGLDLRDDPDMVHVAPDFLLEFAQAIDRPDADAIFISCGALRAIDVIDAIESATGKLVVTSNQAMVWHCLRLAGVNDRFPGFGRLFLEH